MTEYNETFDVVLYFKRRIFVTPKEPVFGDIKKENPNLNTDGILDLYSELNRKYKEDIEKYEKLENKDLIVTGCVLIPEDNDFVKNCKKNENDGFFVEWDKKSQKIIIDTINKIYLNK
jgi:hypothetical protein